MARIAFIASTEVGYGYARLFESVMQHADVIVRRLERLEDATAVVSASAT